MALIKEYYVALKQWKYKHTGFDQNSIIVSVWTSFVIFVLLTLLLLFLS